MKKIAVLMGGTSNEREISLLSGQNVAEALTSLGKYEVVPIVLNEDSLASLPTSVEAVYLTLHGGWGENGGVQAALDARKIPYTGPGAEASRLAMDKVKTKMILEFKHLPTAPWSLAQRTDVASPLPLPVVVKPPCDGSSVGISKVARAEEWSPALQAAFEAMKSATPEATVLVEEFIPGREMTVSVLDGKALPVIEIQARGGWYGYAEKYTSTETRYPFLTDEALSKRLQDLAERAVAALNCRGITRVDFRVSPLGRCSILELNTSPGMTSHSLLPKAAAKAGLEFPALCEHILSCARFGL